jgi:hypothetical protein
MKEYKKEQGNYKQLSLQIKLQGMDVGNMVNGVQSLIARSNEFKLDKFSVGSYTTKKNKKDMTKIHSIKSKFL